MKLELGDEKRYILFGLYSFASPLVLQLSEY